jgi:hypothetical protein
MSVLESDWRKRRETAAPSEDAAEVEPVEADPDAEVPVAAGTSDRLRRTLGKWR